MMRIGLLLLFWVLWGTTDQSLAQSISALQTDFTHATNCTTGVTTASLGQKCIDLDDYTQWYCAAPTGGASNTLCDEPDDWAALGVNFTGQPGGSNPNSQQAGTWTITSASVNSNPNFSNETGLVLGFTSLHGQNDRDAAGKKTFLPLAVSHQSYAWGQRFGLSTNVDCYGMGDCFQTSDHVTTAGGVNDGGGEGTAFRTMQLTQQTALNKYTISSIVAASTCNTTLTQDITRNLAPQTVTVASTTGCVVGDWLTVDRGQIYWTDSKIEAVKLTAVGAGTVTAMFRHGHTSGAPLTPARVLTLNTTNQLGEGRYLVNLTAPPVTAGTVSATSGTGFTGSGTAWADNMVGGDATLPGCIALTSDDYTASPFSVPNTLKSWYGILSVTSATALNVAHRSATGLVSYSGNGPGAYTVRPCARILWLLTNATNTALTREVVLETNTFTWTVGDSIEQALSVDGEVTGELMRVAWYTPGAALRGVYTAWNNGAQRFDSAFRAMGGPLNVGQAFTNGISIEGRTGVGLQLSGVTDNGALDLALRATPDDKRIKWGTRMIGPPTTDNNGFDIQGTGTGAGGKLSFTPPAGADLLPIAQWQGHLDLANTGTAQQPRLRFLQTPSTYLAFPMTASGLYAGRGLQGLTTDYLSGAWPVLEFLGSSGSGTVALTVNAQNDATISNNYGSFWGADLASVWNGSAAVRTVFTQRLAAAAGTNANVTWELRAGTNLGSFTGNPIRFSVRDDGLATVGAGLQYVTATRPTCNAAARGTTFYVAGGAGVADTYELCRKDASDSYAWVALF